MPKRVVVIGATGSIGWQALDIIRRYPSHFELMGAVAGSRPEALTEALRGFPGARAVLVEPRQALPAGMSGGARVAGWPADCAAVPSGAALAGRR